MISYFLSTFTFILICIQRRQDYSEYISRGKSLSSSARLEKDGRIAISLNLGKKLPDFPENHALDIEEFAVDSTHWKDVPHLKIVIMIVGSRGE